MAMRFALQLFLDKLVGCRFANEVLSEDEGRQSWGSNQYLFEPRLTRTVEPVIEKTTASKRPVYWAREISSCA